MESSIPDPQTITYQMPRDVIVRLLFRRMLFRPRRLLSMAILLAAAGFTCFSGRDYRYPFYIFLLASFLSPWRLYSSVARTVDQNSQFTAPKTVTFGASGLTVAGPNFKSELAWDMFKGFSENDTHFFLHLSTNGFDSIIPKSAFTQEQQELFRRCASILNS